jgi:hypothetical protein
MRNGTRFLGVIAAGAALASCGSGSSGSASASSPSYHETGTKELGTQIIYQVSDAFSSTAFASVEVTLTWAFDGLPLFLWKRLPAQQGLPPFSGRLL